MNAKRVCILGGTGFVGTQLANQLTRMGKDIRVLTRHRERSRHLLVLPTLELVECDVHDASQLAAQLADCDAAINLVGILNEKGDDGEEFRRVHVELPRKLIQACRDQGVRRLLHISALNADAEAGPSHYLKTKGEAEVLVSQAGQQGLQVTIFRPSVIFGPDDDFFNRFARLLRLAPYFFPLSCPQSRFAPVYVGNVADAFSRTLDMPAAIGKCYELCGPHQYMLMELVEYTRAVMGLSRRIIPLSDEKSRQMAEWLEKVPGKPFSLDNYRSLQVDSVCKATDGLQTLGITPVAVEAVVPRYLGKRTVRDRYNELRSAARRA